MGFWAQGLRIPALKVKRRGRRTDAPLARLPAVKERFAAVENSTFRRFCTIFKKGHML